MKITKTMNHFFLFSRLFLKSLAMQCIHLNIWQFSPYPCYCINMDIGVGGSMLFTVRLCAFPWGAQYKGCECVIRKPWSHQAKWQRNREGWKLHFAPVHSKTACANKRERPLKCNLGLVFCLSGLEECTDEPLILWQGRHVPMCVCVCVSVWLCVCV